MLRPNSVKVPTELVNVVGDMNLSGGDVVVHLSFALLPVSGPKPRLLSWNGDVRMEFYYPVVTLHDLDLSSGLVEMKAPAHFGWKDNLTPAAYS
jgi:hypothetical protein